MAKTVEEYGAQTTSTTAIPYPNDIIGPLSISLSQIFTVQSADAEMNILS